MQVRSHAQLIQPESDRNKSIDALADHSLNAIID